MMPYNDDEVEFLQSKKTLHKEIKGMTKNKQLYIIVGVVVALMTLLFSGVVSANDWSGGYRYYYDGDDKYKSIAAASILAKTYRDNYIKELVKANPELEKYDIHNNKGYGTKKHLEAIKKYGITRWHRKSFSPCNQLI